MFVIFPKSLFLFSKLFKLEQFILDMSKLLSKEERMKVAKLLEEGIEASKNYVDEDTIKGFKRSLEDIKKGRIYES